MDMPTKKKDLYETDPDLCEDAWTIAAQGTVDDIVGCLMREGRSRFDAERAYDYVMSVR